MGHILKSWDNDPAHHTSESLRYRLRYAAWSMGVCDIILTLTFLSHPDETMIGLAVFGENLTHDTQSLWASSYNQTQKQHKVPNFQNHEPGFLQAGLC